MQEISTSREISLNIPPARLKEKETRTGILVRDSECTEMYVSRCERERKRENLRPEAHLVSIKQTLAPSIFGESMKGGSRRPGEALSETQFYK